MATGSTYTERQCCSWHTAPYSPSKWAQSYRPSPTPGPLLLPSGRGGDLFQRAGCHHHCLGTRELAELPCLGLYGVGGAWALGGEDLGLCRVPGRLWMGDASLEESKGPPALQAIITVQWSSQGPELSESTLKLKLSLLGGGQRKGAYGPSLSCIEGTYIC